MNNDSLEIYICATYVPTEIIIIANSHEQQKRHDVDENHTTITYMQLTPLQEKR